MDLADGRPYTHSNFFLFPLSSFLTASFHFAACFHPQCYMEFLYTDGYGTVPTSGREVMPAGE